LPKFPFKQNQDDPDRKPKAGQGEPKPKDQPRAMPPEFRAASASGGSKPPSGAKVPDSLTLGEAKASLGANQKILTLTAKNLMDLAHSDGWAGQPHKDLPPGVLVRLTYRGRDAVTIPEIIQSKLQARLILESLEISESEWPESVW